MMHTIDGQIPVAEVVAQTFDDGALYPGNSAKIGSGAEASYHLDADLLNDVTREQAT